MESLWVWKITSYYDELTMIKFSAFVKNIMSIYWLVCVVPVDVFLKKEQRLQAAVCLVS